jgi:chromosome partitioning protein
MPVVSFANPKGGVGKSTTALVLGTTLANAGHKVTIIDADPRQVLHYWRTSGTSKNPVNVIGNVTESNVIRLIQERAAIDEVVLVDLEGTASLVLSRAISRSDLILIPMQAASLDALGAGEVLGLIEQEEEAYNRKIDARIIFTRTNPAITTKIERQIIESLKNQGRPHLKTHLFQRQAYNAMFAALADLDELVDYDIANLNKAQKNASDLADELVSILADQQADEENDHV